MVQIYDGYNDGNNEDYIKSLLEKVKGSYSCSGDDSNFEEKFNYSKLVNKYAEATTNYLELIKKDLTKEANKHWMLDEHSWNIQMEYSDEYEESKRHYHDCFLFQDCFMAISHPGAFPGYEHVVDKASIQVKVVTYREEFKKIPVTIIQRNLLSSDWARTASWIIKSENNWLLCLALLESDWAQI